MDKIFTQYAFLMAAIHFVPDMTRRGREFMAIVWIAVALIAFGIEFYKELA